MGSNGVRTNVSSIDLPRRHGFVSEGLPEVDSRSTSKALLAAKRAVINEIKTSARAGNTSARVGIDCSNKDLEIAYQRALLFVRNKRTENGDLSKTLTRLFATYLESLRLKTGERDPLTTSTRVHSRNISTDQDTKRGQLGEIINRLEVVPKPQASGSPKSLPNAQATTSKQSLSMVDFKVQLSKVLSRGADVQLQIPPFSERLWGQNSHFSFGSRVYGGAFFQPSRLGFSTIDLQTNKGRQTFTKIWGALADIKKKRGVKKGTFVISDVEFNGQDARELLRVSALVAYSEAADHFFHAVRHYQRSHKTCPGQRSKSLANEINALYVNLIELSSIVRFSGVDKCWKGRSLRRIQQRVVSANELYRKKAIAQRRDLGAAFFSLNQRILQSPEITSEQVSKTYLDFLREPRRYRWFEGADFLLGPLDGLDMETKDRAFESGVGSGFFHLHSAEGITNYAGLLGFLVNEAKKRRRGETIEIMGKMFSLPSALQWLQKKTRASFAAMGERFIDLDNEIRQILAPTLLATGSSVRDPNFTNESQEKLKELRAEKCALESNLKLFVKKFGAYDKIFCRKAHSQDEFFATDTNKLRLSLFRIFSGRRPVASFEKLEAKNSLMSLGHSTLAKRNLWAFLRESLDLRESQDLFGSSPISSLSNLVPSERSHGIISTQRSWLNDAAAKCIGLSKRAWASATDMRNVAVFLSDPQTQRSFREASDRQFIEEAAQGFRKILRLAELFALSLENASGVKTSDEDLDQGELTSAAKYRLLDFSNDQKEAVILNTLNVFDGQEFANLVESLSSFVTPAWARKWNAFNKKNNNAFKRAMRATSNKPENGQNSNWNINSASQVYVALSKQIRQYYRVFSPISQSCPAEYLDAIELANLRTHVKLDSLRFSHLSTKLD